METLVKDLRYGYRTLLRNPGFTFVAILSLALGIGANTAIFSFVNTIMLRTLPVRDPQRLVLFGAGLRRGNSNGPASGSSNEMFSWHEYQDFRKTNAVFQDILAVDSTTNRVYADFSGERKGLTATLVSGNFFTVLGVNPEEGRFFDASADRAPGASPLAVLSDAFWARHFRRDPKAIGQTFRIGNREYTVVGVAPKGFFGTRVGELPDMWLPLTMLPDFPNADFTSLDDSKSHFMNLIGSLKPGVSLSQASANINLVYHRLLPQYVGIPPGPGELEAIRTARIEMYPADKGLSSVRRRYRRPLMVLMAVVGLVLTIACANVANLLVALGAKRQREMAVRIAIGAGRRRLIRQLLTEGVMLAAVAALPGVALASGAGRILVSLISTGPDVLPLGFDLDLRVLGFTVGVSLLTGIIFSLAPALRASRVDLNSSLKEGKASMASPRRVTFGRALVAGQVALSLTLLVTAGMLLHSFENLIAAGTGFDRRNVLLFKIDSESSGYKQDQRLGALYNRIGASVSSLPGAAAGAVSLYSFHEGGWSEDFRVPGINLADKDRQVSLNFVTPGFFDTFRIPLLAGRTFSDRDGPNSPLAVVIGENFARRVFGTNDVIGKTVTMAPLSEKDLPYRVVGVVRDIKMRDVRDKEEKQAFLPLGQSPVYAGTVAVRVKGNPSAVAAEVRADLRSLEPNLPIRWTTTLADEVNDSLVGEHALAELSTFFAGLALLLSAIGLYGTISFAVARRTGEIGIRMALGAERSGVLGMVLRDAMMLLAAGVAIGLPLSFAAARALESLLYGLGSFDPISAACAVVSLAAVTAVAGYLPARRASRVDPIVALRYE